MLHAGGNAVDAAVAATLVEGVVNPHMHTFGGELSALVYTAHDRRVLAVNGNTRAPRAATIDWFRGHELALIPRAGVLAAGPPAAPHALLATLARAGTLHFSEVAAPALGSPRRFLMHPACTGARPSARQPRSPAAPPLRSTWPTSAAIYLPGGALPDVGTLVTNPDLASTFRLLIGAEDAALGTAGATACRPRATPSTAARSPSGSPPMRRPTAACSRSRICTTTGASSRRRWRTPSATTWSTSAGRGARAGLSPAAGAARRFRPRGARSQQRRLRPRDHRSREAAFADREQFYGDPVFVDVPLAALLAPAYADARRALIDRAHASLEQRLATAPRPGPRRRGDFRRARLGTRHRLRRGRGRQAQHGVVHPERRLDPDPPVIDGLGFPPARASRPSTSSPPPERWSRQAPAHHPHADAGHARRHPAMVLGTQGGDQQDHGRCRSS